MKLVKAKCIVTKAPIVLQVSDDGTKILGYFRTDKDSFYDMSSQIRIASNATTQDGILFGTDDRRFRNYHCSKRTPLNEKCIACPNLKPLYVKSTKFGLIKLKTGEVADVNLDKLCISINESHHKDIEISVIFDGSSCEIITFEQKCDFANSLQYTALCSIFGGGGGYAPCKEKFDNIDVHLENVTSSYERLIFIFKRNVPSENDFSSDKKTNFVIYNKETNEPIISYEIEQDNQDDRFYVIGEMRRKHIGWEFKAIGECIVLSSGQSATDYCHNKKW